MTTLYVKKDGTGTHTQIQSAIFDAVNGDVVNIGPGVFNENIELNKSITLKGAGKDLTTIQGKLATDTFTGASFFAGEDVITVSSTSGLIRGRLVSATGIVAGSRVSQILSGTQFKVSVATATTGNIAKTGCTWASGTTSITLPSTTAVVVGMKVSAVGISALVTAYNATTRVVTLSAATTASGSSATINFISYKSGLTVAMASTFTGSTLPATIQVMNVATDFFAIKDLKVIGFDGIPSQEAATIGMNSPASGTHKNWLIDNCEIVANGDAALTTSPNFNSLNGTVQNCIFSGKTFTGSEPAEVPAFSTYNMSGCEILSTTTLRVPSTLGMFPGTASTGSPVSGTAFQASTYITGISGNVITLNKTVIGNVGDIVTATLTNIQFYVPNVSRQMVVIGNSSTVSNCINTTFKNNIISGQTGAVISSSGNKSMFNTAITVDTVNGLVEGNSIDGVFGAGNPNPLVTNFAIRARGTGTVVQSNVDKITGGRGNSGFYVPNGSSINNIILNKLLVNTSQASSGQDVSIDFSKDDLKQISKVANSVLFSNEANWNMVSCVYKKENGTKRIFSTFKDFAETRKMKLRSGLPGEKFQLLKIIIATSNRDLLVLKRNEISEASSMDLTLS